MKRYIPILLCIALGLTLIPLNRVITEQKAHAPNREDYQYLPNAEFVSIMSMGHQTTVAGLLWIDAVTYFGASILEDKEYTWMLHLIDLITTLDPKFKSGYEFTGTMIKYSPDSLDLKILRRGAEKLSDDWRINLYYSLRLIEKDSNYILASVIMKKFENDQSAPEYIQHIHKTFFAMGNTAPIALSLYLQDYFQLDNVILKKGILKRIHELISKSNQVTLEQIASILSKIENHTISKSEGYNLIINLGNN